MRDVITVRWRQWSRRLRYRSRVCDFSHTPSHRSSRKRQRWRKKIMSMPAPISFLPIFARHLPAMSHGICKAPVMSRDGDSTDGLCQVNFLRYNHRSANVRFKAIIAETRRSLTKKCRHRLYRYSPEKRSFCSDSDLRSRGGDSSVLFKGWGSDSRQQSL
jgi:hypothetical protein